MSASVIKVENLSKQYRIGERLGYRTFRETLVDLAKAPLRRFLALDSQHATHNTQSDTIWALKDVSFQVQQGEVVGIIGRNGAGKSTLLKILSKITEPTEGRVELRGRVGSLLEIGTGFHQELTGHENIYLYGAILGMDRWEVTRKFDEIVAFAELEKFVETPVKRYSSGMYMRLAFAVAAHLETEILLVDEVLAVGDIAFQKKCLGKMGDVSKEGRTVLFVSHNMAAVKALCVHGILLENGQISQFEEIGSIVNTYMHQIVHENSDGMNGIYPICNKTHDISLNNCSSTVEKNSKGRLNLRVEIEIESFRRLNNIGVGFSLTSINGVQVSILGPSVTNYVIEEINGRCICLLTCDDIDNFLTGGDYILSIWLSKPRIEYLVKVDQAAIITIPSLDFFSSGVFLEESHHGIVRLPLMFSVLS